jgi:hypothetical protein
MTHCNLVFTSTLVPYLICFNNTITVFREVMCKSFSESSYANCASESESNSSVSSLRWYLRGRFATAVAVELLIYLEWKSVWHQYYTKYSQFEYEDVQNILRIKRIQVLCAKIEDIVLSSGISHHVVQWKLTNVSEEYVPSIFRNQHEADCFLLHAGFLLGLLLDHYDGGDMLLRNVGWLSTRYMAIYPRR